MKYRDESACSTLDVESDEEHRSCAKLRDIGGISGATGLGRSRSLYFEQPQMSQSTTEPRPVRKRLVDQEIGITGCEFFSGRYDLVDLPGGRVDQGDTGSIGAGNRPDRCSALTQRCIPRGRVEILEVDRELGMEYADATGGAGIPGRPLKTDECSGVVHICAQPEADDPALGPEAGLRSQ